MPSPNDPPEASSGANLSQLELRCPPLPATLNEALNLSGNPEEMDLQRVTEMAERDPGVVVRLLQTVNSAYYGVGRSISSVRRAVIMLGPVSVTGIVIGMNVLKLRSVLESSAADCFTRLIRHSIATGFLTRHLTRYVTSRQSGRLDDTGDPFTAGLLHDFGKLILVYNYPDEAVEFYDKQSLDEHVRDDDITHLEQLLFGYDHTEAGEFAARKLDFPDALADVMRHHHTPGDAQVTPQGEHLVRASAAANLAAKAMGYSFTQSCDWDALAHEPAWTAFIEHDLPDRNADDLIVNIQGEEEVLDDYVDQMSFTSR